MSLSTPLRIALLGEYNPNSETHIATNTAIQHSAASLGLPITGEWISSRAASPDLLTGFDGLWITPGPPHPTMERTLECIRYARDQRIPTFANCSGFQLVVLECAYGINPDYRSHFTSDLLTVAGFNSAGEIRVLEIEDHPFFLATLYVPQALSSGSCPHPLVTGFLKSALQNRYASGI